MVRGMAYWVPAASQPPVIWSVRLRQSRVVSVCDSFNSLNYVSEPTYSAVATVLRFLSNRQQASKDGVLPRQF